MSDMTRSSCFWLRTKGCTCSTGSSLAYCAVAARETVIKVSPVESETKCRLNWPAADIVGPDNLLMDGEKATPLARVQEPSAFRLKTHPHCCRPDTKITTAKRQR